MSDETHHVKTLLACNHDNLVTYLEVGVVLVDRAGHIIHDSLFDCFIRKNIPLVLVTEVLVQMCFDV